MLAIVAFFAVSLGLAVGDAGETQHGGWKLAAAIVGGFSLAFLVRRGDYAARRAPSSCWVYALERSTPWVIAVGAALGAVLTPSSVWLFGGFAGLVLAVGFLYPLDAS